MLYDCKVCVIDVEHAGLIPECLCCVNRLNLRRGKTVRRAKIGC